MTGNPSAALLAKIWELRLIDLSVQPLQEGHL